MIASMLIFLTQKLQAQDETLSNEAALLDMDLESLLNMEVTTAGKKAEKLSEVPASMVVITKEEIQALGYINLVEVIENIPGIYSLGSSNTGTSATNFGVRGFSTNGNFSSVMVLVNGVNQMNDLDNSYNIDAMNIPLNAINRIEIVRGPIAIIYGSTAFLGAINIITNDFDEDESNEVFVNAGSLGTYGAGGYASINQGDFKVKAMVSYRSSEGQTFDYSSITSDEEQLYFLQNANRENTSGQLSSDNQFIGVNARYKDFAIDLSSRYFRNGTIGFLPGLGDEGLETTLDQIFMRAGYNPQVTDKLDLHIRYSTSRYNLNSNNFQVIGPRANSYINTHTTNHELEFLSNYNNEKWDFTVGLSYRLVNKLDRMTDLTAPFIEFSRTRTELKSPYATKSAFAQINIKPSTWLHITAGTRIEHTDDIESYYYREGVDTIYVPVDGFPVPVPYNSTEQFNYEGGIYQGGLAFIPRIALILKANENHIVKLMYGNSKKRAAYGESAPVSITEPFRLGLANMNTYELNYIANIPQIKASSNVSIFYNQMSSLPVSSIEIINIQTQDVTQKTTNDGIINTIGAEFNFKIRPTDKLNFDLSLSYQSNTHAAEGMEDIEASFTPELLGYLKASYKIHDKVVVGLKGRYVGEMLSEFVVNDNPAIIGAYVGDEIPAYFLLDANIEVSNIYKGLGCALYVANIFDSEVRYPTNSSSSWVDKGLLGFGRRFNAIIFYRF